MTTLHAARIEAGTPVKALLDRHQMAQAANVSLRTIDEWREKGVIPYLKIGAVVRFDLDDVMMVLRDRYQVRRQKGGKPL